MGSRPRALSSGRVKPSPSLCERGQVFQSQIRLVVRRQLGLSARGLSPSSSSSASGTLSPSLSVSRGLVPSADSVRRLDRHCRRRVALPCAVAIAIGALRGEGWKASAPNRHHHRCPGMRLAALAIAPAGLRGRRRRRPGPRCHRFHRRRDRRNRDEGPTWLLARVSLMRKGSILASPSVDSVRPKMSLPLRLFPSYQTRRTLPSGGSKLEPDWVASL